MALRERIRLLLTVKGTPTELSLAFSIGVFIGMSPFLGLHTVLALAVASLFRLNKLVTLAGAYITNPWTILPIYTFGTWLGIKVMSHEELLQHIDFRGINVFNLMEFLGQLVVPFFVGTLLLGTISGLMAYFCVYALLKRLRKDGYND